MKKFLYTVWEIAEVFLIAIIAVAAIKYFLIQPFIVNGASMEPTFYDGDYLLVDELSYRFREPERGDVIVFKSPQDRSTYYIKRIVGLPGERIRTGEDGSITVFNKQHPQGLRLNEIYLSEKVKGITYSTTPEKILGDEEYYVLGDNRLNSLDSRYWGALKRDDVVGIVKVRLWPFSQFAFFNNDVSYAN